MGQCNQILGEVIRYQGERVKMTARIVSQIDGSPIDLSDGSGTVAAVVYLNISTPEETAYLTNKTCTVIMPQTLNNKGRIEISFVPTDLASVLDRGDAQFTITFSSPAQVRRTGTFKFSVLKAVNVP
jgi:hypothetical protein